MARLTDLARPIALAAALTAAGCATPPDALTGMTVVTIEAGYRERILLTPGHALTVRIEDVSLADAPATVLAEITEPLDGRGPPYTVTLDVPRSQIDPRHTYAARASIHDAEGKLVFVTTERHAVLTRDAPADARITMQGVR